MPTPLRVLILEDRPEDCDLILHELRRGGFDPVWHRVETEQDYLARLDPALHVILADYALPGFDAVRALRHLKARGLDIPFIVISGTIGDEQAAAVMKEGATDYVLKDRMARLGHAVTSALEGHRRRQALREAETRHRSLFEEIPIGLFRTTSAGKIMDANGAMIQMFGYPDRDALLAVNVATFYVDPAERDHLLAMLKEQGSVRGFERQLRRRDGRIIWGRTSVRAVRDAEGHTRYLEGSIEDVTERRQAEEALRRSEANLRGLLDAAADAIVVIDNRGRIVLVNAQTEELFGYRRDELLGQPVEILLPDRLGDAHLLHRDDYHAAPRARAMGGGLDLFGRRKDGSEVPVEISLSPHETDEGIFVTSVIRDVTKRKETEEALRRSEKLVTMGSLLAGVAHELNNPLSVVLGHAHLLAERDQGWSVERAGKILSAAERCARIVKNFLALARQHPPERDVVGLAKIVHEAIELLAYQLRVDDVAVTLNFAPDLPDLWADPHQLHQVFINLLTNAHQAMAQAAPPRQITITARHDPPRATVTIDLADTGPGMPPEVRSRIFEPFYTTKPPGRGTGLGLALCQGIIVDHGGSIAVETASGSGTVFRIELPVKPPPPAATAAPTAAAQPSPNLRILVVDDEPDVAAVLADLLARDGHRVEIAPNGARALERLQAETYDVILSDLRMPELDGPSFYRTLVHHGHPLVRRFIFVTGDALSEGARKFFEETTVLSLSKPFGREQVRRVLETALRQS
jgi:two-component system NtrC family sensor kinase